MYTGGSLDIKLSVLNGFPRHVNAGVYGFCLHYSKKIKGRDCGTINGHDESSSIRALMKDALEVLVR